MYGARSENLELLKRIATRSHIYVKFLQLFSWLDPYPAGMIYNKLKRGSKVMVDFGCGLGGNIRSLRDRDYKQKLLHYYLVGMDIYLPYLKQAKSLFDDVILCDIKYPPLRSHSIGVALLVDVLEHIDKPSAVRLIKGLNGIVKDTIIIVTPLGLSKKEYLEDNNPYQAHISSWFPLELISLGYKVKGIGGLRVLRGERGLPRTYSASLLLLNIFLVLLSQIFTYKLPYTAYHLFCIKEKEH